MKIILTDREFDRLFKQVELYKNTVSPSDLGQFASFFFFYLINEPDLVKGFDPFLSIEVDDKYKTTVFKPTEVLSLIMEILKA